MHPVELVIYRELRRPSSLAIAPLRRAKYPRENKPGHGHTAHLTKEVGPTMYVYRLLKVGFT